MLQAVFLLLLTALPACPAPALPMQQTVHAPDLKGKAWLNTQEPLESWKKDLKGQVVLLDFWTYCCINCIHVLPDLEALEEEFKDDPFLVIGVHSNKFEQEGEAKNIRQAILRYGIKHPVVVDENHRIWQSYGVRAWPTLVLVDPEGYAVGMVSGEGNLEILRHAIKQTLEEHKKKGTLADGPLRPKLLQRPNTKLFYPGKVKAAGEKLYIADSSAHRILEVDSADGRVLRTFGNGEAGLKDGPIADAQFRNPQGMVLLEGWLYVADTDNHALRRIHLEKETVETIAGNGKQARPFPRAGEPLKTSLNSPWALELDGRMLHIAMAGSHQLWSYDLKEKKLLPLAGSGRENIVDGKALQAQLAQPSGLGLLDGKLYFADSEVSAIRYVDLEKETVGTMVGTGLFDFGDADGTGTDALMQHPLGVAVWKETLLIADTYNNRIKTLDPKTRESKALFGHGEEEGTEDELYFWEPGGLDVDGDTLYVADTNNHRVIAVDLGTKKWRVLIGGAADRKPAEETE